MSLLDSILDRAETVSENHDFGGISVGDGLSESAIRSGLARIAGTWDASEYGMSEAEVERRIAAADTPENRQKLLYELQARAMRRAGLDKSNGRISVMSAGKLPWHGLGTMVSKACNSREAIQFANLAWAVAKIPYAYSWNGETRDSADHFALVRMDTGAQLGSVGSRYQPIQNVDGFAFLDGVLEQFGAKYETAGAIHGGKKVWMLAHMPKQGFTVNGSDDEQKPYVLFTNSHDGTRAAACYPTVVRVECANTFRVSGKDRGEGISIRHTGSVKGKISAAQKVLGLAVKQFDAYREGVEEMTRRPVEIRHYANDVLDAVLEVTQADCLKGADALAAAIATTEAERDLARKSFASKIERRGEILTDILERYDSSANGINGMRGTAWAAFNAVTEHADHNRIGRQKGTAEARASRRFESAISGQADEMKQAAFQLATAN